MCSDRPISIYAAPILRATLHIAVCFAGLNFCCAPAAAHSGVAPALARCAQPQGAAAVESPVTWADGSLLSQR